VSRNFLITGTGARCGKSIVACALGFAFAARGMHVGVLKPAETGCALRDGILDPADTRGVALASSCTLALDLICPYRYRAAAPSVLAAADLDGAPSPDFAHLLGCYREIAALSDVVLVEDIGVLPAPLSRDGADSGDLAAQAGLALVVIIASRPGCARAAETIFSEAKTRGLPVAGYLINHADPRDCAPPAELAALDRIAAGATRLGVMRHKEPLGLDAVERLLAARG
jgi:dethiobiotin synthetase